MNPWTDLLAWGTVIPLAVALMIMLKALTRSIRRTVPSRYRPPTRH